MEKNKLPVARKEEVKPLLPKKQVQLMQRKMAMDSNSRYKLHVYHVFNDPDFQRGVEKLRKMTESAYYKNITFSLTEDHLLDGDKATIKEFAERWCITPSDLWIYADGLYDAGYPYGSNPDEADGLIQSGYHGLCYKIGPHTTIEQIVDSWDYIKAVREDYYGKKDTKRKAPVNHQLVFVVFKAKQKDGLTFTEIFRRYQDGELEGYNGSSNQYKSKDSLERYYNKYRPYPLTDT